MSADQRRTVTSGAPRVPASGRCAILWKVTYDPDRRGGNRRTGAARRLAGTAARPAGPAGLGLGAGPVQSGHRSRWRKQSWLGRFVSTYGWRAYALPVLVAVTGVVVYQTVTGTSASAPASGRARAGPADNRRGGHGDHRRPAARSDAVRRQPADRDAARRRPVHRSRATRPGTSSRAARRRSARAPPRSSNTPSRSKTAWTPPRSAVTTRSPRWSTRRWPTPRAGHTTRSSRSSGSTRPTRANPTSGSR